MTSNVAPLDMAYVTVGHKRVTICSTPDELDKQIHIVSGKYLEPGTVNANKAATTR